jgi:hypothetical protein
MTENKVRKYKHRGNSKKIKEIQCPQIAHYMIEKQTMVIKE